MDTYTKILNEINNYIENVQNIGKDQISLYDLYKKTEEYLKPLTSIFKNNEIITNMNKPIGIIEKIKRKNNNLTFNKYDVKASVKNNKSILTFFIDDYVPFFSIYKEHNKDRLNIEYYNHNYCHFNSTIFNQKYEEEVGLIINKNYDNIVKQLNILEEYSKKIGDIGENQDFYCNVKNLFDINICCTSYNIFYTIKLNDKYNEDDIYNKTWLSKPSLENIVNHNIIEIFKNTYIDKKDLDERFLIILNEYKLLKQNRKKNNFKIKSKKR